jgi:DNA-binding protein YbaB
MRHAVEDAQALEYLAADPDGLAEVTADGRPRITAIRLHPDAVRDGQQHLDQLLTALINDALEQARAGSREALLDVLPAGVRDGVQQASGTGQEDR